NALGFLRADGALGHAGASLGPGAIVAQRRRPGHHFQPVHGADGAHRHSVAVHARSHNRADVCRPAVRRPAWRSSWHGIDARLHHGRPARARRGGRRAAGRLAPESLPVIAYCASCGSKTVTRLVARQSLSVCPGCDRIFFRNPKVVVTALIEEQGRVLLVLRDIEPGRGLWGMPGGFVDWDEHPEVAMVRECREEVLVTV